MFLSGMGKISEVSDGVRFQVKSVVEGQIHEQRQNQFFSGMFLPESLCDMLCVILGLGKYFARLSH